VTSIRARSLPVAGKGTASPEQTPADPTRPDRLPTIGEALRAGTAELAAAGLDPLGAASPRREAELLLCSVTGFGRTHLIGWPERPLSPDQRMAFTAMIRRRATGEPIPYIVGRREFYGLDLLVTPATLIPRPETELLVTLTLAALPADRPLVCADLGTGSGAIAVALAQDRPNWTLVAIEYVAETIAVAAANARTHRLDNLLPVRGNWLAAVAAGSLDAIVLNPPYVGIDDPHLKRGDLRFEPATALTAGRDGLQAIQTILPQAADRLRPGGWLAFEHGHDQGGAVHTLLDKTGHWTLIRLHRDLAGHPRVKTARRTEASEPRFV
jgi:release factor glutamine methyltransferase